jgi:hypothetical protein
MINQSRRPADEEPGAGETAPTPHRLSRQAVAAPDHPAAPCSMPQPPLVSHRGPAPTRRSQPRTAPATHCNHPSRFSLVTVSPTGDRARQGARDTPAPARYPVTGPHRTPNWNHGINTLPFPVAVHIVRDMNTTRGQKEASSVERHTMDLNQWSRPSCFVMPSRLGIAYALGSGPVPV